MFAQVEAGQCVEKERKIATISSFFSPFLSERRSPGSHLWVWEALWLLRQLFFCLPFYRWDYSAIHREDYSCPSLPASAACNVSSERRDFATTMLLNIPSVCICSTDMFCQGLGFFIFVFVATWVCFSQFIGDDPLGLCFGSGRERSGKSECLQKQAVHLRI